jgi:hypothetical protein
MTKEDNQSFVYIFLFALLSLYVYTNGQIVTYDDYWPGQVSSLVRDGRIGALILYYPLVNIFEMDMSFSGWASSSSCSVVSRLRRTRISSVAKSRFSAGSTDRW